MAIMSITSNKNSTQNKIVKRVHLHNRNYKDLAKNVK